MSDTLDSEPLPEDVERAIEAAMQLDDADRATRLQQLRDAHPDHVSEINALAMMLGADRAAPAGPVAITGYRIVRQLGTGGMGEVYLADQTEPIRRQVALKVIRAGMGTGAMMARFEKERQALAVMNHDAIAKVFDAGVTEAGQPYFVMEYVAGEPLDAYCRRLRLGVDDRLRLLQQICEGVQHAHQKGVIHRDLKPSNILVTSSGDAALPKIIDFGLARAADEVDDGGATMLTRHGQLLGTPEFMSPEQAVGDPSLVDTRTDVYALGAVLYYLLTGVSPLSPTRPNDSVVEIVRRLREDDPARPSTRVTAGDATASSFDLPPYLLARRLRGDIDWIVMKALAKEPDRRYASASALGNDIGRHLNHETVTARPPSTAYRTRKLLRRYRVQFAAAGLVFVTAIAGAVIAIGYAVEANGQERRASQKAAEANTNLARWTRLADRRRLEALIGEANRALWPAVPAKIGALTDWLRRAKALAEKLEIHRTALRELRAAARVDAAVTSQRNRRERVRIAEIDHELEFIAGDEDPRAEPHRQRLRRERDDLEQTIARRGAWVFDDDETGFRHHQLSQLVADLERFCTDDPTRGVIADVEQRLQNARRLREDAAEPAFVAAWQVLIDDVAGEESVYRGLQIAPIPGLMPLGTDRDSGLWELHHRASGAAPHWQGEPLGVGRVVLEAETGNEGIVLVLLPGGTFRMGALPAGPDRPVSEPNVDPAGVAWERPVHEVTLDAFLIGKHETTQAQWQRLRGSNPSYHKPGDDRLRSTVDWRNPVTMVNWREAFDACRRWDLTLPTEARWEYACRAGTGDAYFTGDDYRSLIGYANLGDEESARVHRGSLNFAEGFRDDFLVHGPVGSYKPNAFGLFDIIGNVQEWCQEQLYRYEMWPPRPGDGRRGIWLDAPRSQTLVRGGSAIEHANFCRSAARVTTDPMGRAAYLGFRVCRGIRGN